MAWVQDWNNLSEIYSMQDFILELQEAIIERKDVSGDVVPAILTDNDPLSNLFDTFDIAQAIEDSITTFVVADGSEGILGSVSSFTTANNQFVNQNDLSGDWDNQDQCPKLWSIATLLTDIGDPSRLLVSELGELTFEWARQQFDFLNRLRWVINHRPTFVAVGTETLPLGDAFNFHRVIFSGAATSAAAKTGAISDWNADNFTSTFLNASPSLIRGANFIAQQTVGGTFFSTLQKTEGRMSAGSPNPNLISRTIDFYVSTEASLIAAGTTQAYNDFGNGFSEDNFTKYDTVGPTGVLDVKSKYIGSELIPTPFDPNTPNAGEAFEAGWQSSRTGSTPITFVIKKHDVTGGFDKIE